MIEEAGWDLRRGPRCPDVLSQGGLKGPTGSGQAFQLMVTRDAWLGTGGCVSPRVEVGTPLAWETLHRRPGANCTPWRGQWSPECLNLWHSVPLGVRTMENIT